MTSNEVDAAALRSEMFTNAGDIDIDSLPSMFAQLGNTQAWEQLAREAEKPTDLDHYEGQTRYGKAYGKGRMIWASGDEYEGDFVSGRPHGKGVYTYANGDKFIGEFADRKRNGIYTFANGDVYTGELNTYGRRSGLGMLEWKRGGKYFGDWEHDKENGKGVLMNSNGTVYSGGWKKGKQHGEGVYTSANGVARKGEWKNGMLLRWMALNP